MGGPSALAMERDLDCKLGEALADLAELVPPADLIHFRDALRAARKGKQHGTARLEVEISHGRATYGWVSMRLRGPQPEEGPRPVVRPAGRP